MGEHERTRNSAVAADDAQAFQPPDGAGHGHAPLFDGPGEARALARAMDWDTTRLGAPSGWPEPLRLTVRLCLDCKTAMALWIGRDYIVVYNDAYTTVLAERHPDAMGRPLREVWPEVWGQVAEEFDRVARGESIRHDEAKYRLLRAGRASDAYFAYSLTPLRDGEGNVIAVFNTMEETTPLVRARREKERQYQALFERIDEGLCIVDPIVDAQGKPVDYRFLETNPAFVRLTGYQQAVGQTARALNPHLEPQWPELVAKVAQTGDAVRVEGPVKGLGRWFELFAFRSHGDDSPKVAMLFRDVTERNQAEQALRASEARQAFLVKLGDTLRPLSDPLAVQETAARVLGEQLGVERVAYVEVANGDEVVCRDYVHGVPHLAGRYPLAAFGAPLLRQYREGRTAVTNDSPTETGVGAEATSALAALGPHIGVPLVKGGELVAVLAVHAAGPRTWSADEVALAEETAERTWSAVERARSEHELRHTNLRLRAAVARYEEQLRLFEAVTSTTPDLVHVFDREGRFVYANRRLLEIWGMDPAEALGKTCRELGYERWHHDLHMAEIAQVLATRQPVKGEMPFKAPRTGIAGVYEYIFTPVIGPSGEVELIASTAREVTERKLDEEALRESEARLRQLWESGMVGVVFFDLAAGSITDANDKFLAMVGYDRDDLRAGRVSWTAMTPAEYRALDERAVEELHATGVDTPYEKEFIRKDGTRVPIFIGAATFDAARNRGVSFVLDISKLKNLEHALRKANDQLIESDQRKNHFLAVLSHELRNPLTPIKNSLYILDRAVPGGDQARRAKDVIERQIDQLSHLVDDLLDVTRITRGSIQLHRRRLELNELVRRTIDDHRALFETAAVRLELEPAAEPVFIDADWNRTAQVLSNLLQNAAKFTPRGGRVMVTLERDAQAGQAVIRVADDGFGMKPELLSHLFQPFMQADETLDRSRGGLGLGLALVKGIVEQHGGTIAATSQGLDHGSEFVVRLPLDLGPPTATDRPAAPASGGRRVVLVIEDNVDAAQTLKEVLEILGHEVAVAHDGTQGLAKARQVRPDLVLCDIGLPGMDGYEVARAFRADEGLRRVHLIALSGYALPEDLQRAAEAGFERHLAKPASLDKLEEVLGQTPAA